MLVHHPSTFVAKLPNHHPVSAAGELNQKDWLNSSWSSWDRPVGIIRKGIEVMDFLMATKVLKGGGFTLCNVCKCVVFFSRWFQIFIPHHDISCQIRRHRFAHVWQTGFPQPHSHGNQCFEVFTGQFRRMFVLLFGTWNPCE